LLLVNTTAFWFAGWPLSIFLMGLWDMVLLADPSLLDIRSTSYGVEKKNLFEERKLGFSFV
jgi:hypothetical protein